MRRITAVTPYHHHTVFVHGAIHVVRVPVICFTMVVRCGGGMNMSHVRVRLQHIQVHLYLIQTCICRLTTQDTRYVDTLLVSGTVTLNFTLEQAKGGVDV